jgi:protein phosphatase
MNLTVEVAGKTDVGCVRKNNEDNLGWDQRLGIYVVCDGMGGALAGEVASRMGVDLVLDYFREGQRTGGYPEYGEALANGSAKARALANAISWANAAIHESGQTNQAQHGMGSTLVAALLAGSELVIGHVGDSRVYLLREGELRQLTQDHSLVMEQVRRGLITREQAAESEMQNIIIRALGSEQAVQPDIEELIIMPDDVVILTTDGLTKLVTDEEIRNIVQDGHSVSAACNHLIEAAKANGGDDNITCLLLRVVEEPWHKRLLGKFLRNGGAHGKAVSEI